MTEIAVGSLILLALAAAFALLGLLGYLIWKVVGGMVTKHGWKLLKYGGGVSVFIGLAHMAGTEALHENADPTTLSWVLVIVGMFCVVAGEDWRFYREVEIKGDAATEPF